MRRGVPLIKPTIAASGLVVVQNVLFIPTTLASPQTATVPATVAGNQLAAYVFTTVNAPTVTDSAGNTWTQQFTTTPGGSVRVTGFKTLAASPGSITTVTATGSAGDLFAISFFEISGATNTASADASAGQSGTGAAMTSGASGVPSGAADMALGAACWINSFGNNDPDTSPHFTAGNGTNEYLQVVIGGATNVKMSSSSLLLASAAAQTFSTTGGGGGAVLWGCGVMLLK